MRERIRFPLRSTLAVGGLVAVACAEPAPPGESVPIVTPTALLEAPDQTFSRGGITINYRSIGSGEPVLLIHGYGDNLKMGPGWAIRLPRRTE